LLLSFRAKLIIRTSCSKRSGGNANRTLRFSPSAKYLYDCVREVLREVVSITKTLVHANALELWCLPCSPS
jgi:hypothetical protein